MHSYGMPAGRFFATNGTRSVVGLICIGGLYMKQLPTIELERLLLRPFRLDDANVVQELAG